MVVIGNRPAGELYPNARILQVVRAVDAQLGNAAQVQRASTDANIPLSLGLEAIAIGGGGTGGGAHTLQEWFDCSGRELGLKRILLTLIGLAGSGFVDSSVMACGRGPLDYPPPTILGLRFWPTTNDQWPRTNNHRPPTLPALPFVTLALCPARSKPTFFSFWSL